MCVAAEGTVLSVCGRDAVVDFHGNLVTAKRGLVDVREGDRVLVHAGCIIQKISREEEEQMTDLSELFAEVGAF